MDAYNKIVSTWGDPLLAGAVVIVACLFAFKLKKVLGAVGTLIGGGVAYYIMHNPIAVLNKLGPLAKLALDFLNFGG